MIRIAILGVLWGAVLPGCQLTPDEIDQIRVENELLREELQVVRQNCSYYRGLEVEIEEEPAPAP